MLESFMKLLLKSKINIVYFLFPIISGAITAALCPMGGNTGSNVKFRPPPFVFGIIWPILYLMLGAAWVLSSHRRIFYLILSLSLCMWIVTYSCLGSKLGASWVLLANLMAGLVTLVLSNKTSQALLSPLIGWIVFALLMNTTEVQFSGNISL